MSEHSGEPNRNWANQNFREYLLGRLSMDDTERLTTAVALIPGLVDDLEDAEEELIESYLDSRMPAGDRESFEAQYARGTDPECAAKFRLQQELRGPELARLLEPARPVIVPNRSARLWRIAAVAAAVVAIVLAVLYGVRVNRLAGELEALKSRPVPAPQRGPQPPEPQEQPAGLTPDGGLILPAASATAVLQTPKPPGALIWSPVPDYRTRYVMRVDSASGEERTSDPLTPKDNQVQFAPADAAALTLPWDVFVLSAPGKDQKVLGHYILRP